MIQVEIEGFTPLMDDLVQEFGLVKAAVFGCIWRHCQMDRKICDASFATIGEKIGINKSSVCRHMKELVKDGYFIDLTPDAIKAPHVYQDTGKVFLKMSGGKAASVAQNNRSSPSVAVRNRSVALCNQRDCKETSSPTATNADATFENPVIQIHLEVVGIPLDDGQRKILIERVSDLARWRESLLDYRLHTNWKKSNLSAQLDRYAHWESIKAMTNGHSSGNGKSRNGKRKADSFRQITQSMSAISSDEANAQALADLEAMAMQTSRGKSCKN